MMNLIDSQHGRRWIVDGGRKRFRRNINNDAKGVRWILFQSTFLTHRYGVAQGVFRKTLTACKDPEERITRGDEVTNLWHQFDQAVCTYSQCLKASPIERQHYAINF